MWVRVPKPISSNAYTLLQPLHTRVLHHAYVHHGCTQTYRASLSYAINTNRFTPRAHSKAGAGNNVKYVCVCVSVRARACEEEGGNTRSSSQSWRCGVFQTARRHQYTRAFACKSSASVVSSRVAGRRRGLTPFLYNSGTHASRRHIRSFLCAPAPAMNTTPRRRQTFYTTQFVSVRTSGADEVYFITCVYAHCTPNRKLRAELIYPRARRARTKSNTSRASDT